MFQNSKAKVAIYIRVSTLHQIDRDSLPMQRQDLISYTNLLLNTDEYVIFEDAGYSGKNTDRPKFQEMMTKIREGAFTHLLVWKIDRISRNLLDFATMYNELKELGVIFVSKNEQFDTSTAMGEAMLKIILVFAELERNMTSERVTATMISRAGNGHWNGGRVPYGYKYDKTTKVFSFHPEESIMVKMIHNLYEEKRSLTQLSRELNLQGYITRSGNEWNPVSLSIILKNIFYCGDYRYNVLKEGNRQKVKDESEWITIENHHPALVSHEQKQRILSILQSNTRLHKQKGMYTTTKHIHIFSGIIMCGNCQKIMNSSPVSKRADGWIYSKYTCSTRRKNQSCNSKITSDPIIGEFIFNYILNMINSQNNFLEINTIEELESALLNGDTFNHIAHIETNGLNDMFNILKSGIKSEIYKKDTKIINKTALTETTKLRNEKQKIERALERLKKLYLYSEDIMSESEYIIEKTKLIDALEKINEQIGLANTEPWEQSISDEVFMEKASEFIISQKLTKRNYINYKRLATSVDTNVIRSFIRSIIDTIVMDNGRIKTINFRNGLSHSFIFK